MKSFEPNFPEIRDPAKLTPLSHSFFQRSALTVARQLIGKGLLFRNRGQWHLCQLVEVEAYLGENDPASHSHCGKTTRNAPMFEPGGTCYVYLSYGINYCMNVATGSAGKGEAVLFRAAAPLVGIESMGRRRKQTKPKQLMSGPGKLTQALGIDLRHNGLVFGEGPLSLVDLGHPISPGEIRTSPRIGISKAADLPYRFFVHNSPWLSRQKVQVKKK